MHQFELIQSRLQVELPYLPESHYITPFVSGLREDIKHLVLAKHPTDLLDAFEQAKHMEIALDYYAKKNKFATKPQNTNTLNGVWIIEKRLKMQSQLMATWIPEMPLLNKGEL